ncbi:MAG: hypothetical protein JW874_10000 [Spirochaetales bacterium]|nr:hypothetical protein [Spirochaetales bacterium]
MDLKQIFDKFDSAGFIKLTRPNPEGISQSQKAALNRKGNELFNAGQYEQAKRIFLTTGYTDGLIRVGDHYFRQNEHLEALRLYWIAPAPDRCENLIAKISSVVQRWLIKEKD